MSLVQSPLLGRYKLLYNIDESFSLLSLTCVKVQFVYVSPSEKALGKQIKSGGASGFVFVKFGEGVAVKIH